MDTAEPPRDTKPRSEGDGLEEALEAAARAGAQSDAGEDIAADDAGASKLSLEIDRERKPPVSHAAGEGED